jgi:hypothetical protein
MLLHRKVLLAVVLLGVAGSLSATAGYGLYLRSDSYRHKQEARLSNLLKFPVSLGRIRPLTTASRAFHDIEVTLPARGDRVFRCGTAIWYDETRDGKPRFALDLIDGWLLVGTHKWAEADYQAILKSGLGQNFARLNLRRIHLDGIDLEWQHPDLTLTTRGAVGEMLFDDDGTGRAALRANNLNDRPVAEPISIVAYFTPGAGLRFHEVALDLPAIPFSNLGLDRLLRGQVDHGVFRGRLGYRETIDGPCIELAGSVEEARLEELTEPIIGGPFHGLVNVTVDRALFCNRRLESLRFRGQIDDLSLTELVPVLRNSPLEAKVRLRVHQASVSGTTLDYFSATGQATDLSLEAISALIGRGQLTGKLRVDLRSLLVVDDALQRAEIDLIAVPPDDAPGTIDRELVRWASEELLGFDVSAVVPERTEYARLGVRLVIEGEQLRVFGTHGYEGRTILTVRVLGRELPLVREFDRTFEVGPLVATIRERLEAYELDRVRQWWELTHAPPVGTP